MAFGRARNVALGNEPWREEGSLMQRRTRRVAVTSDQSLVAEAVRTALLSRGFEAVVVPWAGGRNTSGSGRVAAVAADVALMLADLEPAARLREAQSLVQDSGTTWLLLTGAARGPLWGAMLECGVALIKPSSTSLDEVVEVLRDLTEGGVPSAPEGRDELVREWRAARSEKEVLIERMRSLTARERTVLRLLYAGDGVRTIAGLLGVSEATVRSHVKAVLHKLEVSSQLAAVAAFGWLQDDPDHRDPWATR
jgi:DNA-binding NarL/FixJ family response regulator